MNTPTTITISTPARQAAINALAVVGFVALVIAGIWLAVYFSRFVPTVANRIGTAAVYLGQVFTPPSGSTLSVVPTTTPTTISFGTASSTTSTTTTTVVTETAPTPTLPVAPSYPVYPVTTVTTVVPATPAPYGLSDLAVRIIARGYLTNSSDFNSFTPSNTVPSGSLPALLVAVKNVGTNYSGTWSLRASIPNDRTPAVSQATSLAPSEEGMFVAHLDNVRRGSDQTITITVNFDGTVAESNMNNNEAVTTLDIL